VLTLLARCLIPILLFAIVPLQNVVADQLFTPSIEALWSTVISRHVVHGEKSDIQATLLKYSDIKKDPVFDELLRVVADYDVNQLKTQADKLAFWINVYNIAAVKLVADHYPTKSIKSLGSVFQSVWHRDAISIGGEIFSLDHIEHRILRKMNEPRIHFAIVCASLSCPDLRLEAFQSATIDTQLQEQAERFLANSSKGVRINAKTKTLHISEIFRWFSEDFESKGGVKKFLSTTLKQDFSAYRIQYTHYDWSLNDAPLPEDHETR